MEGIHGKWERGKFKYPKAAAPAKKTADGPEAPAAGGANAGDATPVGSPRQGAR